MIYVYLLFFIIASAAGLPATADDAAMLDIYFSFS